MTGYPAFAIDDTELRTTTEVKVRETLAGEKGYKRFQRDGYLTVREGSRDSTGDTSVGIYHMALIFRGSKFSRIAALKEFVE